MATDALVIAGKAYGSRLLVGTGKYRDFARRARAIEASRRARSSRSRSAAPTSARTRASRACSTCCRRRKFTILPNTAGCYTAAGRGAHAAPRARAARRPRAGQARGARRPADALSRTCRRRSRPPKTLVKDGFKVMVYCSDDPILAKQLEELGCVAVMPLASLIGSGMGILNPWNLQIIIDKREGAGAGRRRRRHRVRCRDRDGARLRRRADEHRDRRGARTRC